MPIRPFCLPDDLRVAVELIPLAFHYPENDTWSIQTDEAQNFVDSMNSLRRLWPLIRVLQVFSPPLGDVMRGYLWEEDGRPVGLVNTGREGATATWWIGNVAVLPEYRRRSIARRLVEACVELVRARGGQIITLDVVAGNTPAYALYANLGFETYSGRVELDYDAPPPPDCPLPPGHTIEAYDPFDWRKRHDLMQRITPETVQQFEPVEEGRFRQPGFLRLFTPLFRAVTGTQNRNLLVRTAGGATAAIARYTARTRAGGMNSLSLTLDPAHAALAPALVARFTRDVLALGPGRRIEFVAPIWQEAVIAAAEAAGYTRRYATHSMGLKM